MPRLGEPLDHLCRIAVRRVVDDDAYGLGFQKVAGFVQRAPKYGFAVIQGGRAP